MEYLVIGGYAINYYGFPRATGDLDIWIAIHAENAQRLAKVLRDFGFPQANTGAFLEPRKVIRMGVPPIRLELLTSISGVEFRRLLSAAPRSRIGWGCRKPDPFGRPEAEQTRERPTKGPPGSRAA